MIPATDKILSNAMHAASVWLERIGAEPSSVAVVTVAPSASVAVWTPGAERARAHAHIDDAGAELTEAVAPVVAHALQALPEAARVAALDAVVQGARLQALLFPAGGEFALRMVRGGQAVELCSIVATRALH